MRRKGIRFLEIPEDYKFMDAALIDEITATVDPIGTIHKTTPQTIFG